MTEHVLVRPRFYENEVSPAEPEHNKQKPTIEPIVNDEQPKAGFLSKLYDNKITIIIVIVIIIIVLLTYMFYFKGVDKQPDNTEGTYQPADIENQRGNIRKNDAVGHDVPDAVVGDKPVQKPVVNAAKLDDLLSRGKAAITTIQAGVNVPNDVKTEDEILELMEDSDRDETAYDKNNVNDTDIVDNTQNTVTADNNQDNVITVDTTVDTTVDATVDTTCVKMINGRRCKNKKKINGLCTVHNKPN